MVDPFVARGAHIQLGAKGAFIGLAFGPGINQRPLRTRERHRLGIAFNEILTDFGADEFQQKAQMPNDRVIAQNGMALLLDVPHAHHNQQAKKPNGQTPIAGGYKVKRGKNKSQNHHHKGGVTYWK